MKERSMTRFDDGEKRFSTTTTETGAKAVAAVLKMEKEVWDEKREFWVHGIVTSQNELLRLRKEVVPDSEWTVTNASTEEMAKKMEEMAKVYPKSRMVDITQKTFMIFGKEFRFSDFGDVDNEVLRIGLMDERQIKEVLKEFAAAERSEAGERDVTMIERVSSTVRGA
jgi:hypothetical protein